MDSNKQNLVNLVMLIGGILLISGCRSMLIGNLLPNLEYNHSNYSDKNISLGVIRGGEIRTDQGMRDLSGKDEVTPELFSEALYLSLKKSNMFKNVIRGNGGSLEVEADLVSQEVIPGFPIKVILFIHYRLINDGAIVWKKSFISTENSLNGEPITESRVRAMERAVKNNLEQFLTLLPTALDSI